MAKSIPEVKIGNETFEIKDLTAREHLIEAKDAQPTNENNKLWIKSEEHRFMVPDYDEFTAVKEIAERVDVPVLTQAELDEICV